MPDITPTYLRSTSDGKVLAVFPGGVEILAGENYPTVTPPDERRVRWVRESDGSLVADLAGARGSFESYFDAAAYLPIPLGSGSAYARLRAEDGIPGSFGAYLQAKTASDGAFNGQANSVLAGATGNLGAQRLIINGEGYSGFHHYGRYFLGPLPTTAPPTPTSGMPFVIPADEIAGSDWWIRVTGSGYRGTVGAGFIEVYLDGVNVSASPRLFFNTTGEHHALPEGKARIFGFPNLLPGTHYVWLQSNGITSDSGDGFTWEIYPGNF